MLPPIQRTHTVEHILRRSPVSQTVSVRYDVWAVDVYPDGTEVLAERVLSTPTRQRRHKHDEDRARAEAAAAALTEAATPRQARARP